MAMFEMGRTEIKLMFTKSSIYHSGKSIISVT